jgi:hypothetical protein
MRGSPAIRRAPVHRFADGAQIVAPKRDVAQALKHEVPLPAVDQATSVLPENAEESELVAPFALQAQAEGVTLRPVSLEDIDHLWDWSREDAEGVKTFLGHQHKNSRDLFAAISRLADMEAQGTAWMQAITRGDALIGFVLIAPIQRPRNQPPVGAVHLYITVPERGDLDTIMSEMLQQFDATFPTPMTLSVIVTRPEWTRILAPLGFESATVLTRPAFRTDGSRWA